MKKLIIKILVSISKKLGYRPEDEFGMVIFKTSGDVRKNSMQCIDIFYTRKGNEFKYRGADFKIIRVKN